MKPTGSVLHLMLLFQGEKPMFSVARGFLR
jgi:hypothetical protein